MTIVFTADKNVIICLLKDITFYRCIVFVLKEKTNNALAILQYKLIILDDELNFLIAGKYDFSLVV